MAAELTAVTAGHSDCSKVLLDLGCQPLYISDRNLCAGLTCPPCTAATLLHIFPETKVTLQTTQPGQVMNLQLVVLRQCPLHSYPTLVAVPLYFFP